MTKEEDLKKIRQVVESAILARNKLLDDTKRKNLEDGIRLRQEYESRLRATGVVNLFENIRDEGIVTGAGVTVESRAAWLKWGNVLVQAYLENGSLVVHGNERYVVGKSISMLDAVGKAIANPGPNLEGYPDSR